MGNEAKSLTGTKGSSQRSRSLPKGKAVPEHDRKQALVPAIPESS